MATSSGILKDCIHITYNETIKSHNNVTFKLIKTGKCVCPYTDFVNIYRDIEFFCMKVTVDI